MRLPTLGSAPQQMDQGTEYQTLLAFTFHGGQNTHCSLEYYPQYLLQHFSVKYFVVGSFSVCASTLSTHVNYIKLIK
jgi:hypothetical protein